MRILALIVISLALISCNNESGLRREAFENFKSQAQLVGAMDDYLLVIPYTGCGSCELSIQRIFCDSALELMDGGSIKIVLSGINIEKTLRNNFTCNNLTQFVIDNQGSAFNGLIKGGNPVLISKDGDKLKFEDVPFSNFDQKFILDNGRLEIASTSNGGF